MRNIIISILLLLAGTTYGQTFTEIRANRVLVSNALRPGMDTIMLNARDSGTLAHKNGRIYVWNGFMWNTATDLSTIPNIYNSDGEIDDERTVIITDGNRITLDATNATSSSYLQINNVTGGDGLFKIEVLDRPVPSFSAGVVFGRVPAIGDLPYLNLQASAGLYITHNDWTGPDNGIVASRIDTLMPFVGSKDTLLYWNPSTGQVQRALAPSGGGGGLPTSGTYAERIALVSPPIGHRFYQTDERIGYYVLGYNNFWEFQPPARTLSAPFTGAFGWTGSQTGSGAAWGFNALIADQDSAHGSAARLTTGTTATGVATISNAGGSIFYPPYDNDTTQKAVWIMHGRVLLPDAPTNAENYVFTFGPRITTAIATNDSTSYGAYFRISFHTGANVQLVNASNGAGAITADSGIPISGLANRWATLTVMFTNRRAWYFIDGVQVGYLKTTVGAGNLISGLGFGATMRKLAGTTARRALVNEVTVHATHRTN